MLLSLFLFLMLAQLFLFWSLKSNKLMTLMVLEALMLTCICKLSFYDSSDTTNLMFLLVLLIFMVTDSVMGVSTLINFCRHHSFSSTTLSI